MSTSPAFNAAAGGALRLSDWGLIRASGPDARSFLHGQLTQDVLHLPADQARLAGYCSPKGRLLASFVMWADAGGDVLLACSADVLPAALKRLSMFVLRAKCKLTDDGTAQALWGLAGASAAAWLAPWAPTGGWAVWQQVQADGRTVLRLPDARADDGSSLPRWLMGAAVATPAPALPELQTQAWTALEARAGVARVVGATVEQFVPQMVNLELVGGVNFQKGCYPGQEVVARSQYRGTLKRRAYLLQAAEPLAAGQEVFHSADPDQPAGLLALAGSLDGQHFDALAELKIAATLDGSLHLGSAQGPVLQLGSLPYALPVDAA